jgi:DNA-binding response OmpR family regulator
VSANPTILVTEEDSNDEFFLARAFKRAGSSATVQFVQKGRQASDYLQGNEPYGYRAQFPFPNLLVLNLRVWDPSGLELLAWVRERFAEVVIGVLSGVHYEPAIKNALALGAKFCIVKPPTFPEWVEVARQLTKECAAALSAMKGITRLKIGG